MNIATVDIQRKSQIRESEKDKDYRKQFFYSIIQSSKEDGGEPGGVSEQNVTNGNEQDNEPSAEYNQLSNNDERTNEEPKETTTGEKDKADSGGNTTVESKGNITEESQNETEIQVDDGFNKENVGSSKYATEETELAEHGKKIDLLDHEKLEDNSESSFERVANKGSEGRIDYIDSDQHQENRNKEEDNVGDNKDTKDVMKEMQNDESDVLDDELVKKSSEKEATTTVSSENEASKRQSDNSTKEQQNIKDMPKDNDLPQAITLSEVPKAHSIDISNVKMASDNGDKQKESTSEPTSPTTPSSPHEARPLIPEFLWSPMHQRLLADILFAIESDLQVWKRYVSAFVTLEIYVECPHR